MHCLQQSFGNLTNPNGIQRPHALFLATLAVDWRADSAPAGLRRLLAGHATWSGELLSHGKVVLERRQRLLSKGLERCRLPDPCIVSEQRYRLLMRLELGAYVTLIKCGTCSVLQLRQGCFLL